MTFFLRRDTQCLSAGIRDTNLADHCGSTETANKGLAARATAHGSVAPRKLVNRACHLVAFCVMVIVPAISAPTAAASARRNDRSTSPSRAFTTNNLFLTTSNPLVYTSSQTRSRHVSVRLPRRVLRLEPLDRRECDRLAAAHALQLAGKWCHPNADGTYPAVKQVHTTPLYGYCIVTGNTSGYQEVLNGRPTGVVIDWRLQLDWQCSPGVLWACEAAMGGEQIPATTAGFGLKNPCVATTNSSVTFNGAVLEVAGVVTDLDKGGYAVYGPRTIVVP